VRCLPRDPRLGFHLDLRDGAGIPNERGQNIDGLMKITSPDEWWQDRVAAATG
jgi:hypothetical protein